MAPIKFKKSKFAILFFLVLVGLFLRERYLVLQTPAAGAIDALLNSDCGVVLTGSAGRLRESFEVLNLGKVSKLIISGVYKNTQLHEIFPQLPYYPEVKPENIILEKISGSTHQNAIQSLLVVESLKCKNILLMTSQLHMYRASRTFKANFPDNIQIQTYATTNPIKDDTEFAILFETTKSLFYSILPFIQISP